MKNVNTKVKLGILRSLANPISAGRPYTLSVDGIDVLVRDGLITRGKDRMGYTYVITDKGHEFLADHTKNPEG